VTSPNPYAPPQAHVANVAGENVDYERMNRVASGQRLLIVALITSLLGGVVLGGAAKEINVVLAIAVTWISIVGAWRISGGLGGSVLSRTLYVTMMLLPLINLIIMITLSIRATRALRKAGYEVGFFGAPARWESELRGGRIEST
jgi:hypothetical protein